MGQRSVVVSGRGKTVTAGAAGTDRGLLAPVLVLLVSLNLLFLPAFDREVGSDSAYKLATANPTFNTGQIIRGDYALTQQSDNRYLVLRETGFLIFWFLDSSWGSFQAFTEAPREKLLAVELEMEGYQQDTREVWHVQFYDFSAGGWYPTWYQLGAFPTQEEAVLRVQVTDPSLARRFVGPGGSFRMRLADQGTASFNFELNRTTLYIDLLRVRFAYDVTPPLSSITHPPDLSYTNATSLTITGTSADQGTDRSGVAGVQVSLDGGSSWFDAQPRTAGDFSSWSYPWNIPAEGTYLIRSRAIDAVGNAEVASAGTRVVVDWTPPQVGDVNPSPGAQNVPVNAVLTATFLEQNPMDEPSLNHQNFTLVDEEGNSVPGTVSYDPATKTATFTPSQPLYYGYVYTATLGSGIKDLAGNPLPSYSWTFRTADILLLSLQGTYNRDGTPGNGGVDFGLVGPEGSPYTVGGGSPPYAISLNVLSSTSWNMFLKTSSALVDESKSPRAELPANRLSWALAGSGAFTPFTETLTPVFGAFQVRTPQPGGRPVRLDLRLEVRWEDEVGDYEGEITFVLLAGP